MIYCEAVQAMYAIISLNNIQIMTFGSFEISVIKKFSLLGFKTIAFAFVP